MEPPPGHEMPSDEHDTDNSWAEEDAKEETWRDLGLDVSTAVLLQYTKHPLALLTF